MSEPIRILSVFVLLLLSAFFSGSEIALQSFNRMRMEKMAEEGKGGAKLALRLVSRFTYPLSTILIGNTLVNMAASSVATVLAMNWILSASGRENNGLASLLSTVVMTVTVLIFGEVVPKILAKEHAEPVARGVSRPIGVLTVLLLPLTFLVSALMSLLSRLWGKDYGDSDPSLTEEDLSTLIETSEEEGVIDEDRGEMLQSALEFKDTTVGEILTPRIDLVTLDIDDDFEVWEQTADASPYSRIPVYEDSIDNIIGILNLNRFYKEKIEENTFDIRRLLTEPLLIHKTMKLPRALSKMRETRSHLAIVVDEYGGTLGAVTLEDILEEIVGEIWDESDTVEEEIRPLGDGAYEVLGDMNIEDFFDEIGFEDPDFESEYTTVGGWCVEMLDADPKVGEGFDYRNLSMTVLEMEEMRVTLVRAVLAREEEEETS
ncbi:MAG: HlyC/CorC family transporter [Clostridia bacterium]|nr:HlyC/CorC family transporter [Clostridia bacterium]